MSCFSRSKMTYAPFISGINNISDTAILGSHRVTMDVCGSIIVRDDRTLLKRAHNYVPV